MLENVWTISCYTTSFESINQITGNFSFYNSDFINFSMFLESSALSVSVKYVSAG